MAALRAKPLGTTGSKGVPLLLTAASLALAACGGGGSGGGTAGLHAGGQVQAARSIPVAGSVTQSSDQSAGVTANAVIATVGVSGGELTSNVIGPGWRSENWEVDGTEDLEINRTMWHVRYVSRVNGDGSKRTATTLTDADPNDFDDDYLVMGYWFRVPAKWVEADGSIVDFDETGLAELIRDTEYGVYANGGDPYEQNNIRALTGTASYSGDATAVYIDTDAVNERVTDLIAAVALTADFGTDAQLGTISGTVNNFAPHHSGAEGPYELTAAELAQLGDVTLGTANIGDSHSGFFTGDTSVTALGGTLTGKWGGQFYGNGATPQDGPGAVAGTFGATDGQKAIIGTYGARP